MKSIGQTAIEYLYTYGWMFFGVSVIGGFFLSSGAPSYCSNDAVGFASQSLRIEDFGINADNEFQLLLRNTDDDYLDNAVRKIELTDTTTGETIVVKPGKTVDPGSKAVVTLQNVTHVNDCRQLEAAITYDRGSVLRGQTASGHFSANIGIENGYTESEPAGSASFQVSITAPSEVEEGEQYVLDYNVENTGDSEGTQDVEFYFDNTLEDTAPATLGGGEQLSGSFSMDTSGLDGSYPVRVETGNDTETTSLQVNAGGGGTGGETGTETHHMLGVNTSTMADIEIYSNGSLQDSGTADTYARFNLTAGNYTIEASAPDYRDASASVELDSDRNLSLVLEQHPPEIVEFFAIDNSQCNGWRCFFGRGNGPARYDVTWNVTDRYSDLQDARILFNGVEEFSGKSGTESYNEGGAYDEQFTIRLEAEYENTTLCREVVDTADDTDPSGYSNC